MKAPRSTFAARDPRDTLRGEGIDAPAGERDDAERAESTHDLQCGLQVTDVSDTMSNDLIDQLFHPQPLSR